MPNRSLEDIVGYVLVAALTLPLLVHAITIWPKFTRLDEFHVSHEQLSS